MGFNVFAQWHGDGSGDVRVSIARVRAAFEHLITGESEFGWDLSKGFLYISDRDGDGHVSGFLLERPGVSESLWSAVVAALQLAPGGYLLMPECRTAMLVLHEQTRDAMHPHVLDSIGEHLVASTGAEIVEALFRGPPR